VLQPNGGIIGVSSDLRLTRYRPDGSVDAAFGSRTGAAPGAQASALALDVDGSVIAAGSIGKRARHDFVLARYNSQGFPVR
jgi:hypothetical protein